MTLYTSPEYAVVNGGHTYHTPPSGSILSNVMVRWKGISDFNVSYNHKHGGWEANVTIPPNDHCQAGICTFPSVTGNQVFDSMTLDYHGHHEQSGESLQIEIWVVDTVADCTGNTLAYKLFPASAYNEEVYWNPSFDTGFQGDTVSVYIWIKNYGSKVTHNYIYNTLNYHETIETKTYNPTANCNGYSGNYPSYINNGYWTDWVSVNSAFFTPGVENDIVHSIGGSQDALFQFKYDYIPASSYYTKTKGMAYAVYVPPPSSSWHTITKGLNYAVYVPPPPKPTPVGYAKIKTAAGIVTVIVCSKTDPYLYSDCVRIVDKGTIYACDVVLPTNSDASFLRTKTPEGILAFRKVT